MLVKNPKGRIVDVTDERGAYLLNPNPVLMRLDGKPKTDENGRTFGIVKGLDEQGYTLPTKAEIKAYEDAEEESRAASQEEQDMREAGARAIAGAAYLANKAAKAKPVKTKPKPTNDADAELEKEVRDAEDDAEKYEKLSDEGKEMYTALFGDAPDVK